MRCSSREARSNVRHCTRRAYRSRLRAAADLGIVAGASATFVADLRCLDAAVAARLAGRADAAALVCGPARWRRRRAGVPHEGALRGRCLACVRGEGDGDHRGHDRDDRRSLEEGRRHHHPRNARDRGRSQAPRALRRVVLRSLSAYVTRSELGHEGVAPVARWPGLRSHRLVDAGDDLGGELRLGLPGGSRRRLL